MLRILFEGKNEEFRLMFFYLRVKGDLQGLGVKRGFVLPIIGIGYRKNFGDKTL